MSKKFVKPVVLSVLFLTALIVFSIITNQDNRDLTAVMDEATLPIIRVFQGEQCVATLHGYTKEMQLSSMRDTIVPVDHERILPVEISDCRKKVDRIRYEIRSMDGERLVAKNEIPVSKQSDHKIRADLTIQNLLEENREYQLVLILKYGKQQVSYYTRLVQTTNSDTKECMDFALEFHENTFRKDAEKFISRYMDAPSWENNTLQYVDLGSSLSQITWADFQPEVVGKVDASFKEVNSSYNVITICYMVSGKENGETKYYNVEEYYRLRTTGSRMYVLNFERTLNQIFSGETSFLEDKNRIQLGIRDSRIEYDISEAGDVIAFVQEGELWCFNRSNGKIVKVFSFRGAEGTDLRDNWDQHEIKIARVDEAGSVDFVVYGYMNRGSHEGEVGIAAYHYDGIGHTVEEEVFIPSVQSYEVLKAEMGQLLYVNDQGILYLMMNQKLYSVDLNTHKPKVLVNHLKDGCYKISDSNHLFAWVESEKIDKSDTIRLMNLKNGSVRKIKEKNGFYVQPLGFIDDDFIYGAVNRSQVITNAAGNTVFPMDYLKIMGTGDNYKILKKYEPERGKIDSIHVEDYTITVSLMKKKKNRYVKAGEDSIMNRQADTQEKVYVGQTTSDVLQTQYQLVMKNPVNVDRVQMITARAVLLEKPRILSIEEPKEQECFYVYVKGNIILATESIADAIICANENMGVVVDNRQQYIWMRARKSFQSSFTGIKVNEGDRNSSTVVQTVSAMLNYCGEGMCVKELTDNGATPKSVIESTLKDEVVLDISGCTVDEILYYISSGSPVFAMTGENQAVLVTGYTNERIYYYDSSSDETKSKSIEDANHWFASAGNIFFTYLKN